MSKNIPVVLLTFANQEDAYLNKLKQESKKLNQILSSLDDKGVIKVHREESATIDELNEDFIRFDNRVCIFHYAGHADGESLRFEGGDGYAQGIAELLGQLEGLKLVFLNGCSTQAQVDYLLEKGVKAVIATSVAIDDEKAVLFSENFYRAMANYHSIESAFNRTVAYMRSKYGGDFEASVVRRGEIANTSDKMPWGLYVNDGADDVLSWEFPTSMELRHQNVTSISEFYVNRELENVIGAIIEIKPELRPLCELDGVIDTRAGILQIIQNFPLPIANQIRLLVSKDGVMDTPSVERVKQIVSVYVSASKFLFYIAISDLWHNKRNTTLDNNGNLIDFLHIDEKQYGQFDFFRNFIDCVRVQKEAGIPLYIPEFADVVDYFDAKDDVFYHAYDYLEALRAAINLGHTDMLQENLIQKAADGEHHLSIFLTGIAFMVEYSLITIRDIHVINPKYLNTQFDHFMRRLNVLSVGDIAVSGDSDGLRVWSFDDFKNNASVMLAKNIQKPETYLNLSPLVIDINSFKHGMTEGRATIQQLYMYGHRDGRGDVADFKYYLSFHNIYIAQQKSNDQYIVKGNKEEANVVTSSFSKFKFRKNIKKTDKSAFDPVKVLRDQFDLLDKDLIR